MAANLTLKWGNVKGWEGMRRGHPARIALDEYFDAGAGISAMTPQTLKQRELICKIIDAIDGEIQDDWTGEIISKDEAKEYVRNYKVKA